MSGGHLLTGGGEEHSVVSDPYKGSCISASLPPECQTLPYQPQNTSARVVGSPVLAFSGKNGGLGRGRDIQAVR